MKATEESHDALPVRGFLLHLTHYDPRWNANKPDEEAFDAQLAMAVIDEMAVHAMNTLVVDVADAVRYESHPELARPYTVPMQQLRDLADAARQREMDVVPKLNFSQTHWHGHNDWFRPHHHLFDNEEYWRRAFQIMHELIEATRPSRFFHIGMDEDHDRSYTQYVEAIKTLRDGLAQRDLRAVMWNDSSCMAPQSHIHVEKALFAEERIPKDVVQLVWDYRRVEPDILRRVKGRGFELWGAPGSSEQNVKAFRDALLQIGGTGLIITTWTATRPRNRDRLLEAVRTAGDVLNP